MEGEPWQQRKQRRQDLVEHFLCIGLHWLDQPSGISDTGDQGKGMSESRLSFLYGWLGYRTPNRDKPSIHQSMGPDGMHTWVLRELADIMGRLLTNIWIRKVVWRLEESQISPYSLKRARKRNQGTTSWSASRQSLEKWWNTSFWRLFLSPR